MSKEQRGAKIKLITEINNLLLKYGSEQISVEDFDILYSLELDELYDAKLQVRERLIVNTQYMHNLHN